MSHVTYVIIEHDGGWAYRMGGTISETFPSRERAHKAAARAAAEQRAPDETTPIQYETPEGEWREESARGSDRPRTDVKD
ncbi:MAG: DUF2188 domain-containing protein [Pseudomonadota bacterium]|nr:DUF2188 domain-containing protein [Pseudomonadota bacterium]